MMPATSTSAAGPRYDVTCAWCAGVRAAAGLAPRAIATATVEHSHGICRPCELAFRSGLRPLIMVASLTVYGFDPRLHARAS